MTRQPPPGSAADAMLADHLTWLRITGLTPATIEARRRNLVRLERALGVPLADATEADLQEWAAGLTLTPGARANYLSHAREFYRWRVTAGLALSSPAERLPVPRQPRRLPRPIGEAELMAAVTTAPKRVRPWLVLAGWAGLRAREIAYLRREDIKMGAEPVILVTWQAGKGQRERVVPASPFVLAELPLSRRGWLFRRADHTAGPVPPHLVSHLAGRHLAECGTAATLHQLRHRFATVLYQQTHDLRLVQELLGHSSVQTTALYAAWDTSRARPALDKLPVPTR